MSKISFPIIALLLFTLVALAGFASAAKDRRSYGYNPTIAMEALEYCKIAYCPAPDISMWNCAACGLHSSFQLYNVYTNSSLQSQAYSGYNPSTNRIVVAFRGSSNIQNWIQDLTFEKVPYYPYPTFNGQAVAVHQGFFEEFNSYSARILRDMDVLIGKYPSAQLFVTGHSLGASVAVHCALALTLRYGRSIDLIEYSFGTPRVGNAAFSELVSYRTLNRTQRIVHDRDPVPHLPALDMGFLHSPHESWYQGDGDTNWDDCNDWPGYEDPNCSDSLDLPVDIEDHLHYLGRSTDCNLDAQEQSVKKTSLTRETVHKLRTIMVRQKMLKKQQNKKE